MLSIEHVRESITGYRRLVGYRLSLLPIISTGVLNTRHRQIVKARGLIITKHAARCFAHGISIDWGIVYHSEIKYVFGINWMIGNIFVYCLYKKNLM